MRASRESGADKQGLASMMASKTPSQHGLRALASGVVFHFRRGFLLVIIYLRYNRTSVTASILEAGAIISLDSDAIEAEIIIGEMKIDAREANADIIVSAI